jgi:recombination protein RecR
MNKAYTDSLNNLINEFSKLPGIGTKSAERLAFHILKSPKEDALKLAACISDVKTRIMQCSRCHNLSEQQLCPICSDPSRDSAVVCVVEQPKDLITLENTGFCTWKYHVLGGHIAPLEGVEPEDLTIEHLIERVRTEGIKEIVMATNPTVEGDGTALYICSLLRDMDVKVTRLARGLPAGSTIEFSNSAILADAILGRTEID